MNAGILAMLTLLGTVGAGIALVWYRDLIFGAEPPPRRPGPRRPPPSRPRRLTTAHKPETVAKRAATVSAPVSGVAIANNDAEMIALRALAKLIRAEMITETAALETVFAVRAGSSKAYKNVQAKLKQAQSELADIPEPASPPPGER